MIRRYTVVFYDGRCGLCHRAVRFALNRDPDGSRFRFAPLQGDTPGQLLDAHAIAELTDSIVVVPQDGKVLQESDAVLLILDRIGGGWRLFGRVSSWVPRSLRDLVYRGIARIRYRLFEKPPDLCPLVPDDLKERFLP